MHIVAAAARAALAASSFVPAYGLQFEITTLAADLPVGPPYGYMGATSLAIMATYPDPAAVASGSTNASILATSCIASWPGTPAPTLWIDCEDPAVQWRVPTEGWTGGPKFDVELFLTVERIGGLFGCHGLDQSPGNTSDPDAYLTCIQMGKFTPLRCQLGGSLAAHQPPVVVLATEVSARPA